MMLCVLHSGIVILLAAAIFSHTVSGELLPSSSGFVTLLVEPTYNSGKRNKSDNFKSPSRLFLFSEMVPRDKQQQQKQHGSSLQGRGISSSSADENRRSFLWKSSSLLVTGTTAYRPDKANAAVTMDNNNENLLLATTNNIPSKPSAPLSALLPAMRVKQVIDRSIVLTSKLVENDGRNIQKEEHTQENHHDDDTQHVMQELSSLLLQPQNFTQSSSLTVVPQRPSQQYLDSYDRQRRKVPLLGKPGAYLVQQGEIDSWKRLKRQEGVRETQDEIRAALNVYTTNLNFNAEAYMLTAPAAEKSKLIRTNALPDVKTVIASDMGMRYLYRNEILSAMEEARAELVYQLSLVPKDEDDDDKKQPHGTTATTSSSTTGRNSSSSFEDASELLRLLQDAQNAFDRWLSLIDPRDVQAAIDALEAS